MLKFLLFGLVAVPMALIGATVATIKLRGTAWRVAAAVPLVAVAGYFAVVLIPDWARDPSSHNLLPFELGMYFWPTFPYMVVLLATYWRTHMRKGRERERGDEIVRSR